jgi:bifunctional UDP-N-acetylglucosamine pyrophosphorylase/glucosamine-1-phosphate N-acetyltransferase
MCWTRLRLAPRRVVLITGHGAEEVEARLAILCARTAACSCAPDAPAGHRPRGAAGRALLADDAVVLILNGDVP